MIFKFNASCIFMSRRRRRCNNNTVGSVDASTHTHGGHEKQNMKEHILCVDVHITLMSIAKNAIPLIMLCLGPGRLRPEDGAAFFFVVERTSAFRASIKWRCLHFELCVLNQNSRRMHLDRAKRADTL